MPPLPTVLLLHQTRQGSHYDWLLGCPAWETHPEARLWTARIPIPSQAWQAARTWTATELPPHRRLYLRYQGPISRDRGCVTRVDQGTLLPLQWTPRHIIVAVSLQQFAGRIELHHLAENRWRATAGP